jgi:hypothetical protein
MTVKELIEHLQRESPDSVVYILDADTDYRLPVHVGDITRDLRVMMRESAKQRPGEVLLWGSYQEEIIGSGTADPSAGLFTQATVKTAPITALVPDEPEEETLLFSCTVKVVAPWWCPVRSGAQCEDAAGMPRENHVACRLTK